MPKNADGSGSNPKPPSPRVMRAVNLLLSGETNTIKATAEAVGMNPDALSRAFRKPHVGRAINEAVRARLSTVGMVRAAGVLESLLTGAKSEYVRLDSAKHILAVNGVKPSAERSGQGSQGLIVQINLPASLEAPRGPVIEHESPPAAQVEADSHE